MPKLPRQAVTSHKLRARSSQQQSRASISWLVCKPSLLRLEKDRLFLPYNANGDFNFPDARENSLFLELFSLLIRLGKYPGSRCRTGVFDVDIGSITPKSAKFPVKFPVCRESAWRRVRSAQRRQPTSPRFGEFLFSTSRKIRQLGSGAELFRLYRRALPNGLCRQNRFRA